MSDPSENEKIRAALRKVRQVEIRTNRLVTDALTGAYHSVFKGRGMDFEDVREYTPGDDIRGIDWNVTARMDKPFVKKFREERELTIMILVDLSASGNFGSREQSKRELAAELASVLALSASRNNDKAGLGLFSDRIEHFVPPRKGRSHILRLVRDILFYNPAGKGTDIVPVLEHLNRIVKRRAIVFLLTDFLQGPDGRLPDPQDRKNSALFRTLAITRRRHDLICLNLTDARERALPNVGLLTLEDSETGQIVEIDTGSARVRQSYLDENLRRLDALKRGLAQMGIDSMTLETGQPYITALQKFFETRGRKR